MERMVGVEEARGQLGRLVDEVSTGPDVVILSKRGRAQAFLVGRDEYARYKVASTRDAREALSEKLEAIRRRVDAAGLDAGIVDEAVEAARRLG